MELEQGMGRKGVRSGERVEKRAGLAALLVPARGGGGRGGGAPSTSLREVTCPVWKLMGWLKALVL